MFDTDNDTTITAKPTNPASMWITVDERGNLISEGVTPDEAIKIAKQKTDNFTVLFVPKEGNTYIF